MRLHKPHTFSGVGLILFNFSQLKFSPMDIVIEYFAALVFFLVVAYFITEHYKIANTGRYKFGIVIATVVIFFTFKWLFPETYQEDTVRMVSTNILADIVLYLVICKYKLVKPFNF